MAAVHEAARGNDMEALERLLDEDPGLLGAEHEGWGREQPLHVASGAGSLEAACLLLDRGAAIDARDGYGRTPLMWACVAGYAQLVSLLIARGADAAVTTSEGSTMLILASYGLQWPGSDYVEVIRLLLRDGRVPIDAGDQEGCTALWHACLMGYTERARVLLLEGRADRTVASDEGETPMAVAQRKGSRGCIKLLEVRGHTS